MRRAYLGIDVGTASARAGLFDAHGRALGFGAAPLRTWRPRDGWVEQSSEDIFAACGLATRAAIARAGIAPEEVAGIGFAATCSLVLVDDDDRPVSVSVTGRDEQNVIVWMDHRAVEEAERINETRHEVLRHVGGAMSPEMQLPKLAWLKRHLPEQYARVARAFDLADFLSYRATGSDTRSLCTTTCKWTYSAHANGGAGGFDAAFFESIGLSDLLELDARKIGRRIRPLGERAGELSGKAAAELGLRRQTPVGIAAIDAHAGALGVLGAAAPDERLGPGDFQRRLALVGGTSTCHLALSPEPRFIPGVWGPYYSALLPGWWLNEGGQSATGALIDATVFGHARGPELAARARDAGTNVYALLNQRLEALATAERLPFVAALTRELHVLPDHHGNRSPRADPTLLGGVSGLTLSTSDDALARLYLATLQGLAYGTRHILAALASGGYAVDTLVASGGDAQNPAFLREHADATGCRIVLPEQPESTLLGAAVLGALSAGEYTDLWTAMTSMSRAARTIDPSGDGVRPFHDRKFQVFLRMHEDQRQYRLLMRG